MLGQVKLMASTSESASIGWSSLYSSAFRRKTWWDDLHTVEVQYDYKLDSYKLLPDLADHFQMFGYVCMKKEECGCHVCNHDSAINLMPLLN